MSELPLTLYRVGQPSIGEVWGERFSHGRSTGGIGTGVYAFRDEQGAKRNVSRMGHDKDIHELTAALDNPIQPGTEDATYSLNKLSRAVSLTVAEVDRGNVTWDRVFEQGELLSFTLSGGLTGSPRVDDGSNTLGSVAREVLFNTPELQEEYSYSTEDFVGDFLQAARAASEARGDVWDPTAVQPLNKLLWPDYDGFAPRDGAGGNSGQWGCVIFKEKIDQCVGRETEGHETVEADVLRGCWG